MERGQLGLDDLVTDHVPELADTAWAGATVRHVLDMRSGVAFVEDYTDAQADVRQPRRVARLATAGRRGRRARSLCVPGDVAFRNGSRWDIRLPLRRDRRPRVGLRARRRTRGWRTSSRRWCGSRWAPSGTPRSSATAAGRRCTTAGCARPRAIWPGSGSCCSTAARSRATDGPVQVLPAGWLRSSWAVDSDIALGVSRVAGRAVVPGRLVSQPVLVPARRAGRCVALPRDPRPADPRQPPHAHGLRQALDLADRAGPDG